MVARLTLAPRKATTFQQKNTFDQRSWPQALISAKTFKKLEGSHNRSFLSLDLIRSYETGRSGLRPRSSVEPVTNPKVSSTFRLVIIILISVKYEYMGFASRNPKVSVKPNVEFL